MNIILVNKILNTRNVIGEAKTVELMDNTIKIVDLYNQTHFYNCNEWDCVCSNEATCSHCGKTFFFNDEFCAIYRDEFICDICYQDYYGYCNECGELNKYTDMNDDIICKGCESC